MTMSHQHEHVDMLITGCTALVGVTESEATFETDVTIVVNNGRIEALGPHETNRYTADETIDANGLVAIPGLTNCHTHSAMTLFRGAVEDVPVEQWFNDYVWPMEVNLVEEDVYLGTLLASAEMISSGVTAFADHYFHMDAAARAVEESGIRANLGEAFFSSSGNGEGVERSAAFAERWNGRANGRIATSMAPHAPYTCTDKDLETSAEHARRLGIRIHTHAAENVEQTESSVALRGMTPIEVLERTGVLDAGVLIAHGCGIVESDLPILAEYSDRVAVASCPKVYLKHGFSQLTPIHELVQAGITVGLGTDGPAGHNTLDMFESMRLIALTEKSALRDATWLTTSHALALATENSAKAIGLGELTGALAPGRRADIVLVDLSGVHCQPLHSISAALTYSVRAGDVQTVVIDGKLVLKDRQLLTVDTDALLQAIRDRLPRLVDTSHGTSIQHYAP